MIQDPFNPPPAQAPSHILGAVVATRDGSLTLSHPEHGECYHTQAGAKAEAQLLYVESSGLQARLSPSAHAVSVLDVGLGLGLNASATLAAWAAATAPPPLLLTSLEVNEDLVTALASGLASWQQNWTAAELARCTALKRTAPSTWSATLPHPGGHSHALWTIHVGDASGAAVPSASCGYAYIWQDPFSPEKNPPLWSASWFERLRAVAAPDCVLMTYSVAGFVRRAVSAGGWDWEKIPSLLPGKRAWLRAKPYALNQAPVSTT